MFYQDEYVRSRFHGLGQVLVSGRDPLVRFLGGLELRAPGDTLQAVSQAVYAYEVENRRLWECYLDWRIYGHAEPLPPLLPARPFDLAEAMQRQAQCRDRPHVAPVRREILYFISDDLERDASRAADEAPTGDRRPIRVRAMRITGHPVGPAGATQTCGSHSRRCPPDTGGPSLYELAQANRL